MSDELSNEKSNRRFTRFSANMCQIGLENMGLLTYNISVSSSASFCEEGSFSESLRRNLYKTIG